MLAEKRLVVEFSTLNGMTQLINEPTHSPQENIKTCIDHIYTNKPEGFTDSGVLHSPDAKCKHSIIHGTLNFSIPPPPPYSRKIWKYDRANNLISINWSQEFLNRSVDESVDFFTKKLLEILGTYIPNKIIKVSENDAPWMNEDIKSLIKRKQHIFQRYKKHRVKIRNEIIL